MIQWTSGSTIQCATGSMNQRNNPHEWLTDWLADWMNGWMNERIKESMNHCINEPNSQWTNELCKPLPRSQQLSGIWSGNRTLAIQSRSHFANFIFQKCSEHASFLIFLRSPASTRPHLPSALGMPFCLRFLCEIELSLQSGPHFANLISQKCSDPCRSPDFLYAFYIFNPTLATPPQKTQGFAPETVLTREFTRVRTVTLPMIVGGWHDDGNANHDKRP